MSSLNGTRVAILEARMSSELANLISRHGGNPYSVPAVKETPLDCSDEVSSLISRIADGSIDIMVFQTGVGANILFKEAEKLGRRDELLELLQGLTTVCRGPKPTAALKRAGVQVSVTIKEPYTTGDLIEALGEIELPGKSVAVMHYGERNRVLTKALIDRGAFVNDMCLYEWLLPDDIEPLQSLIHEILTGQIDAIAVTSQVQVRHLYRVASRSWFSLRDLSDALNTKTIVAAVGPTSADALKAVDVNPDVVPEHPKMGHMVNELVRYVNERTIKQVRLVS